MFNEFGVNIFLELMMEEMHFRPTRIWNSFFRMRIILTARSYQPNVEWTIPLKEQKKIGCILGNVTIN